MVEWIKKLLSNSQDVSIMRCLVCVVVMDIILMWDYQCIQAKQFLDMGLNNAGVIIGTLGAKALQSFTEKRPGAGE